MNKRIRFKQERCIGCGACVIACIDQNDIPVELGACAYRSVTRLEEDQGGARRIVCLSQACEHCEDAPCIAVCPRQCLWTDERTGMVVYDNADCTGCRLCERACPYKAPKFFRRKMDKCDGCSQRVARGLLPACVKVCPLDALLLDGGE